MNVLNFGVSKAVATVKYLYDRYIGKITTYTVASQEETDKSSFDFATLEEALTFAENCSIIGGGAVNLHLQDGTHYFERDSYQPNVSSNSVAAYNFNHTHLFLSCDSKGSATITFSPDVKINGGYVFRTGNTKIGLTNVYVDYALGGAECTKNAHFIRTENTYVYLSASSIKGLNKDDYVSVFYAFGNTFIFVSTATFENFSYSTMALIGSVTGYFYKPNFVNLRYSVYVMSASGNLVFNSPAETDVDNPLKVNQTLSSAGGFYIDTRNNVAPKDSRRTLADSSERPTMDGVPDGTSYLQLDINKPIWYKGKNDDGDDIWIDSDGNEV